MNETIRKIDAIKNMAVFQDFQWTLSARDKDNRIVDIDFKKINIFYGRNYSGKTTLSRIYRALETGSISDKYNKPEFQLLFEDGSKATQNSLNTHGHVIRVFNEDFIKDNLRFIVNDEHSINSFAILGEDNARLKDEISRHEAELGVEESKTGLQGDFFGAEKKFAAAEKIHTDKSTELKQSLSHKANNTNTGIKHNKLFGDANYNVSKIKADIATVTADSYSPKNEEELAGFRDQLKEERKLDIPPSVPFNLQYSLIASKGKDIIERKIKTSAPIQEYLEDALLAKWVQNGREYHEGKRNTCGFCGSDIPAGLWEKLDKHFNQESEDLQKALDELLSLIEIEYSRASKLWQIDRSVFYSNFTARLDIINNEFCIQWDSYCETLQCVQKQVEKRKNNIFTPLIFNEPKSVEDALNAVRGSFEILRDESNKFGGLLDSNQSSAREALRLNEVYKFINDIKYTDECAAIKTCETAMEEAKEEKNTAQKAVDTKRKIIAELEAQLRDESKGAERVNNYLNDFFGHQFLSLKAIQENSEDASSGYRFEVTRNGEKAFHLSEGECSLMAFCYFMAKLEDTETKDKQPIIWIDDPISSLDTNHIFFIYSLINSKIVKPEKYKEGDEVKERDRFKQLFISTHNLDFLKYLKRLPSPKKDTQHFMINRTEQTSDITLMPKYLKDYVTEFNFLFHQIHKCAHAQISDDQNHACYYNFGNNTRKFLEAFLYFKYPNAAERDNKLVRFFGDDSLAVSLMDRINNEFSHLDGVFERSMSPIDVPEMKTTAQFILKKIEEKDPNQYSALCQSINVSEEPVTEPLMRQL